MTIQRQKVNLIHERGLTETRGQAVRSHVRVER